MLWPGLCNWILGVTGSSFEVLVGARRDVKAPKYNFTYLHENTFTIVGCSQPSLVGRPLE